jgi:RimJ/RimL family protein N-acetyltransferase
MSEDSEPGRASLLSARLELRPFQPGDAAAAHRWFGDPVVMRYTPFGPDATLAATHERLATYRVHQERYGFSKWLLLERRQGIPIGDAGLMWLNELEWPELGFRLAQPFWGRGYATEAARAWVSHAFTELQLPKLVAFAHPQNVASHRVLERLGFRRGETTKLFGMAASIFVLNRDEQAERMES